MSADNGKGVSEAKKKGLRSKLWFDNPENPGMTALYLERYLNFGLTRAELQSGKPIIGIAQTGSDLSPCNRHHLDLAKRVREGITAAGGVAFEFPVHPIQETGKRAVEMVWEDLKPSDIMTREAFENAIIVNSAIGGSTNAPIHINAIARHIGVELSTDDWQEIGHKVPLLVNLQPAGKYLGEEYHRAGGVPAVVAELMKKKLIREKALTANGKTMGDNCRTAKVIDADVIFPIDKPMREDAGFIVLKGNLFDSAIMKTSVISKEFRDRYLSNPKDPEAFEGRAIVFEGPEDYHHRIDDPALKIDEHCMLFVRGTGPIGYPGSAEVVNMQPPAALIKRGITALPCIGDGRQSGTSGSPSILNASPEAAANGGLALLRTGDQVRIDLKKHSADILISDAELAQRRADLMAHGGFQYPASQTPWQEIQRSMVDQLSDGMVLKPAVKYQRVAQTFGVARDNH